MGSTDRVDDDNRQDWSRRQTSLKNSTLGWIVFGLVVLWFVIGVVYGWIANI